MDFGLFLQPLHHPSTNPTQDLEEDLDLVTYLDRLGFDEVWVGEHHSTGWENIGSPEVFIAAAAERTESIRFGTGVLQLGLHHPLVALDRMITLDHLTRGRVAFGMGVGGGIPSDLTVFGLDHDKAGKRMNESIEAMMGLLESDGPFSMKTDWFELKHSILQMRPYTEPHFRFAVASTHDDNVRMMGRVGGLVLTGGFPERVPDIVNNLAAGAAETGIDAGRDQIRLSYVLHVAPTQEEAIEGFRDGAIREFYEFQVGVNGRPEPPEGPDAWFDGYCEQHLIGTPEHVASKLEQIVAESGGVGGFIFMNRDWAGLEANRESWRLFADQVVPHFV